MLTGVVLCRASVGIHASAVDGASTLRAAVASRMRNQRVRYVF